jgi:hypothetical protein
VPLQILGGSHFASDCTFPLRGRAFYCSGVDKRLSNSSWGFFDIFWEALFFFEQTSDGVRGLLHLQQLRDTGEMIWNFAYSTIPSLQASQSSRPFTGLRKRGNQQRQREIKSYASRYATDGCESGYAQENDMVSGCIQESSYNASCDMGKPVNVFNSRAYYGVLGFFQ